jgi:hypothetical protein
MGASDFGVLPPRKRQRATSVAPFQLAYTVSSRPSVELATAGTVRGVPRHGKTKARYVESSPTNRASNMSSWRRLNSLKYGDPPQPTN